MSKHPFSPFPRISTAVHALEVAPLPLGLGVLLASIAKPRVWVRTTGAEVPAEPTELVLAAAGALAIALVLLAVRSFFHVGFLRLHEEVLDRGSGSFGTLLSGRDRFLPMLGAKLLFYALTGAAAAAVLLPSALLSWAASSLGGELAVLVLGLLVAPVAVGLVFYVSLGLGFVEHAVVFEGLAPVAAARRSWELMAGQRLRLVLLFAGTGIACGLVAALGLAAFLVGVVVSGPLALAMFHFGLSDAYLRLVRPPEQVERWELLLSA